jgi:hypothetical protein
MLDAALLALASWTAPALGRFSATNRNAQKNVAVFGRDGALAPSAPRSAAQRKV